MACLDFASCTAQQCISYNCITSALFVVFDYSNYSDYLYNAETCTDMGFNLASEFKHVYNMRIPWKIHKTKMVNPWKCPAEDCQYSIMYKHNLKYCIQALHLIEKPEVKSEYEETDC